MVESNAREPLEQPPAASQDDLGLDQFETIADGPGISLDELSRAYAELIGKGADPYTPPDPAPPTVPEQVIDQSETGSEEDTCALCPKSIIEAILFVGHPRNEPVSSQRLSALMRGVPPREVDELVEELNAEYRAQRHVFHLTMHGAGYRLELRDEFASLRSMFYGRVREARLSQSVIDVLAIVAYQQGCTRHDVEDIRRRPSGGILAQLVRRHLLRIERPDQKPRAPRYFITDRFLQLFGLESLGELPQSHEMD